MRADYSDKMIWRMWMFAMSLEWNVFDEMNWIGNVWDDLILEWMWWKCNDGYESETRAHTQTHNDFAFMRMVFARWSIDAARLIWNGFFFGLEFNASLWFFLLFLFFFCKEFDAVAWEFWLDRRCCIDATKMRRNFVMNILVTGIVFLSLFFIPFFM